MTKSVKKKRKVVKSVSKTLKSGKKVNKSEMQMVAKSRQSDKEAAKYVANLMELHKLQGVLLRKLAECFQARKN